MVYFMLHNPGPISDNSLFHLFPLDIEPFYIYGGRSLDISCESGQTQTSFFICISFCSFSRYRGVYHENNRIFLVVSLIWQSDHDNTLVDAYLRSRQSYALMFWIFDIREHGFTKCSVEVQFCCFDWC